MSNLSDSKAGGQVEQVHISHSHQMSSHNYSTIDAIPETSGNSARIAEFRAMIRIPAAKSDIVRVAIALLEINRNSLFTDIGAFGFV